MRIKGFIFGKIMIDFFGTKGRGNTSWTNRQSDKKINKDKYEIIKIHIKRKKKTQNGIF